MRADLHMHTWCSDGQISPAAVAVWARDQGLKAWSITDHDCISACVGIDNPAFIPGCEFTTEHDGREIHVVGLGLPLDDPLLGEWLALQRGRREERCEEIRYALQQRWGIVLPAADIKPAHAEVVTRSHIASALKAHRYVSHIGEAFERYIGDQVMAGLDLPAYPGIRDTADMIHGIGGVALLAHPGLYGNLAQIDTYMAEGLDGLETNHPNLDPLLKEQLPEAAHSKGWLESCGSDMHYRGARQLGDWRLSRARLRPLLERLGREALLA
jgi:predicted metal-dependent phosphoesterase TrpH